MIMKKLPILSAFFLSLMSTLIFAQSSQDSTGLLGDHFSLEAALETFKNSNSLEDFEKKLNTENNYVNNLDLNEDKLTDYVRIVDIQEDNTHAIILRVELSESESQDIAVIEVEKYGDESAMLQIVGDKYLYGVDKYVEPFEIDSENNGDGGGPSANNSTFRKIIVNVWLWPSVKFIYAPSYKVYVSPWRWSYYPSYWKPWRPHPWRWHFNKRKHNNIHFHAVSTRRIVHAHKIYKPQRKTSKTLVKRSKTTVVKKNGKTAAVKKTGTKKTLTNKQGNKKVGVKKTKTKKTVTKKHGNKKAGVKKTTTKKKAVKKKKG